jgi:hypothetical protein
MRSVRWVIAAIAFCIGDGLAVGTPSASAQGYGSTGSLGGYGAASGFAPPGIGNSSPMVIPYGGGFAGFMPSRMVGGSTLSFRSRQTASMGSTQSSFSLSSLSGEMFPMSGGLGGSRPGARTMSPRGSRSTMGLGGGTGLGGTQRMRGAGGTSVMPPSIGYPFRQPPSLIPTPTAGTGMSM